MEHPAESRKENERLLVVSVDSHVSPPVEVYRPFCDPGDLGTFDEFVGEIDSHRLQLRKESDGTGAVQAAYNARVRDYTSDALNWDPQLRLEHMDADGVAAEVVFHGGFNRHPIPFFSTSLTATFSQDIPETAEARRLRAVGIRMYNRWLADWVSASPGRLLGLAHVPIWDVEATVAEIKAAHAMGLAGVNLPAPRLGLRTYNYPEWDPVWRICSDLSMTLHTHGGGGELFPISGPGTTGINAAEVCYAGRRGLSQLIFGGAFERFPLLRLFLTEQTGGWLSETMKTLDSAYLSPLQRREQPYIRDVLPRLPSDYFRSNCLIGGSFLARMEAVAAIDEDYWRNLTWGRDFPHPEGTWPFTKEARRMTFGGLPLGPVRAMLGETATSALGLDERQLRAVAARIGPEVVDLQDALMERPAGSETSLAFRTIGTFA